MTLDPQLIGLLEDDLLLNKVAKQFDLDKLMHTDVESNCIENGVNVEFFFEILKVFYDSSYFPKTQLRSFPVDVILDYLHRTHRYYIRKKLTEIEQAIMHSFPEKAIADFLQTFFLKIKKRLIEHIGEEERILFPYIKALGKLDKGNISVEDFKAHYPVFTIKKYAEEHDDEVEQEILSVREYIIRAHSGVEELFPYRILLNKLDSFEKELRVHALIEDEVLVPKALEMEKRLLA